VDRRRIAIGGLFSAILGCHGRNGGAPPPTCVRRSSLSVCAGPTVTHGIDVSTYQGAVDWALVAGAGIDFAFARVSDGLTNPDAQFAANWSGMRAAGVRRGLYQYLRASEDCVAQADLVLQQLGQLGDADLPLVMDIETADGASAATVQTCMHDWLNHLHAAGQRTMIYTAAFMSSTIGSGFGSEPLWVANYGVTCPTMPGGWSQWAFWQSSGSGRVAGISVAVDLDEFDGDAAALGGFDAADGGLGAADGGVAGDAGADMMRASDASAMTPDGGECS
jgi:lysozyme